MNSEENFWKDAASEVADGRVVCTRRKPAAHKKMGDNNSNNLGSRLFLNCSPLIRGYQGGE